MNARRLLASCIAVVALLVGAAWLLSLPPAPAIASPASIPTAEASATLSALKPPKRARPVIAVIGINDATETTDYLMAYGILKRAGVADVMALATRPGPVALYPALKVEPDATIAQFDTRYPTGADYVIVPAMSRDDDPAAIAWIRRQAASGAAVIGICAGAKVVAEAGLLDGRRATTHWYYRDELLERHPSIRYVADRRLVVDRGVATTTGITASMPMMLTLIEAIAGHAKAADVARDLGMAAWDARHDSDAFRLNRPFVLTVMGNSFAVWNRDTFGVRLTPDLDEVSLALVADAWSRTYRSRVTTFAPSSAAVATRHGIRIVPDEVASASARPLLPPIGDKPAQALERTLGAIAARYGKPTADVVAMQLEYPRQHMPGRPGA